MGYPPNPSSDQPQSPDPSQQPGYPPQYPPQGPMPQGGYPPPPLSTPWQPGYQQPPVGYPGYPPPQAPYPQQPGGMPYQAPMLQPVRQRGQLPRILISVAIIAVIVIAGVIISAVRTGDGSYSTNAPGASCDKNGGYWLKNKGANTDVSLTCQQSGLLVTQTSGFDLAQTIFFGGKTSDYTFPQNYRVQVKASFVAGGDNTLVGLGVHDPLQGNTTYIGQAFQVDATGYWSALRGDTSGNLTTLLGEGTVTAPAKTATLTLEVHGPEITFTVNDAQATTITDATYSSTSSVALFLKGDAVAGSAASALFTQFQYTPLSGATLTANNAQATATALTQQPYQTANPGQGCDKNGGQWAAPAQFGDNDTTVTCGAQGTQVGFTATTQNISRLRFFGKNGTLSNNYAVTVKADMRQLNGGCAGIYTRGSDKGTYRFFVCDDGSWEADYVDNSGSSAQLNKLADGQVAKASAYTITATVNGATQTLALNGTQVSTLTDSNLTTTHFVALLVLPSQNGAGSAILTDFSFAPQP